MAQLGLVHHRCSCPRDSEAAATLKTISWLLIIHLQITESMPELPANLKLVARQIIPKCRDDLEALNKLAWRHLPLP